MTSLNQKNILETNSINAAGNQLSADENPCIVNTPEVVNVNKLIQVNIGQGEGETRWQGCPWKALLFKLDIIIYQNNINTMNDNKKGVVIYAISF